VFEILSILPISFWAVIAALLGGGIVAWQRMRDGTGLPTLAVLGTTAGWYIGDAFYNDYANNHAKLFVSEVLTSAWWQVAWFVIVLIMIIPGVNRWVNRGYQQRRSGVVQLFKQGVDQPALQKQLNALFTGCVSVWIVLLLIVLVLLKDQVIYYVFPFLGHEVNPWSHGQIGAGLDCLSVPAIYLQLLSATMFGVVLALATNRRIRSYALLFLLLAWPYFIFNRTRNTMLALVIPAILCWVFLRLRGGMWKKALVLLACFLIVNTWMKFVIANRTTTTITAAFRQKGLSAAQQKHAHNEGLNMFEELCWINTFIENGTFRVDWGANYFAELVNPIPRGIWHGKPLIGLDYAIARGHHVTSSNGSVDTTISTGMIGQGVVNLGRILGPAFAAFLMSLWIAWLARFDLQVNEFGRLPLYALGLILTFNLGRDITLIVLYPFIFGALLIWWMDRQRSRLNSPQPSQMTQPKAAIEPSHQRSFLQWKNNRKRLTFSVGNRGRLSSQGSAKTNVTHMHKPMR
jgi:hypothetical protein